MRDRRAALRATTEELLQATRHLIVRTMLACIVVGHELIGIGLISDGGG